MAFRAAFDSKHCPACGGWRQRSVQVFCSGCEKQLPINIMKGLRNKASFAWAYYEAMKILRPELYVKSLELGKMARKVSKKTWRPLFDGTFIGPVQITNALTPSQNFEAKCHRCSWASYPGTNEEARDILLWHLDNAHFNPPHRAHASDAEER